MTDSDPFGPGHVIADKFRLTRRLGQGGMGSVWAADHLALHSAVAIKIIDPAIAKNEEALGRFMREAQAAAALRSPHVVQTFDYGVDNGVPFIAMELLEGQSLAQRLESVGKLSIEQTANVLTQVGRAISRAHDAGIIHRDLKPDNIFLVQNDDEEVAKVLDFGIAKDTGSGLGSSSQTRTGAILGTPYYMSPEQAEGNRKVDRRTDLWSLAIIGYECVVGGRPFESEALGDLILQICVRPIPAPSSRAAVPPGFDEWFAKGTERDPERRFESARELTAKLRVVAGLQTSTEARGTLQTFSGATDVGNTPGQTTGGAGAMAQSTVNLPRSQPTSLIAAATVGALVLVGGVITFALHSHRETAEPAANAVTAAASPGADTTPSNAPPPKPAVVPALPTPAVVPARAADGHEPEPLPAASTTPARAVAEPVHPATSHTPEKPAKIATKPAKVAKPTPSKPATPKPPAKQRVDLGF